MARCNPVVTFPCRCSCSLSTGTTMMMSRKSGAVPASVATRSAPTGWAGCPHTSTRYRRSLTGSTTYRRGRWGSAPPMSVFGHVLLKLFTIILFVFQFVKFALTLPLHMFMGGALCSKLVWQERGLACFWCAVGMTSNDNFHY